MRRLQGTVEMADGTTFEYETRTADYVRFEHVGRKHGWGGVGANPALWEAFTAWAALNRTAQYAGTWDEFLTDAVTVDARQVPVPPTSEASSDD